MSQRKLASTRPKVGKLNFPHQPLVYHYSPKSGKLRGVPDDRLVEKHRNPLFPKALRPDLLTSHMSPEKWKSNMLSTKTREVPCTKGLAPEPRV